MDDASLHPPAASPYARFRRDHRRVLARLVGLESAAPGRGRRLQRLVVSAHLRGLRRQFDTHMAAEEAVLYPTLAGAFPEAADTLAPLSEEHAELREMLASLEALLGQAPDRDRDEQIVVQIRDLVDLLRAHIRKEESVVYDVSERVLRARELRGLARGLAPFFPALERRGGSRPRKGSKR